MGKAKKTPKFAVMKKIVTHKAIKQYKEEVLNPNKKDLSKEKLPRNVPQVSSALYFKHNTALGPPYRVLVDTNFINFSIQNKLDLEKGMMDCLYAKCTPCITDCVMAELEKLGQKYRVALRIAKDPRFERLPCTHKGTYADDCLVDRVTQVYMGKSPVTLGSLTSSLEALALSFVSSQSSVQTCVAIFAKDNELV
ncbi:UNVERIFIED_CONTAM: rRNA-processing protein FCF1 [Sesamum calycinum]|uniref:rRNA-processing protein FCF1 n=1 Tax=Sesamum calycinum TaxID=2727403 RepID=A0AAW2T010_9LAMI